MFLPFSIIILNFGVFFRGGWSCCFFHPNNGVITCREWYLGQCCCSRLNWTSLTVSTYPADHEATLSTDIPMGRATQPFEIEPAFLHFMINQSYYVTGQVLHVNWRDYPSVLIRKKRCLTPLLLMVQRIGVMHRNYQIPRDRKRPNEKILIHQLTL